MKRGLVSVIGCAVLALVGMSACGGESGNVAPKGETPGSTAAQELVIYTGRDHREVKTVIERFMAAHPEYQGKVSAVTLGAQDALDRLRAEKSNPQAGFLWGGTQQALAQGAAEGLFTKSTLPAAANLDPARRDPNGLWHAEMLLPEVIIYNNKLVKPEDAPKDWDDLITPAWKDKIVIRDVGPSGTMRTIFCSMIYRHYAVDGKPDKGYDWLRKLDANTKLYAANPDDMYLKLDRGVGTVTVWNMQDALIQPRINNRPWGFVMPASGAPVLLDGVAVVNNAKAQKAGQDFQNFLMDPQLQAQLAKDYYQIPAITVPDSQKPDWLKELTIVEMKVDWKVMAENEKQWITYWAANIKGKGKGKS